MIRLLSLSWVAIPALGCMAAPPSATRPFAPAPIALHAPDNIAALLAALGDGSIEKREAAAAELRNLGTTPEFQASVVEGLRASATAPDPELRGRARSILGAIDRSEGMISAGSMTAEALGERIELALRYFADGSVELMARLNGGREELFSGSTLSELSLRVTQAARDRGYTEEMFLMKPDGSFTLGRQRMRVGMNPEDHWVPDYALWVTRVPPGDRTLPERARGCWRVEARMIGGRGYRAGIRVGDLLSEVDGKRPATLSELRQLLKSSGRLKLIRIRMEESELVP